MTARKHAAPTQQKHWLEHAWPEGHKAYADFRETVNAKGTLPPKTKALIGLAAASLQRCKHCVAGKIDELKSEHGATDQEIAETMLVASLSAAGTNLAWAKEVFVEKLGR
ncbi:MAG: carboxymuconolactone decarboxylase family protein [Elusimicrobia bacterium]|nr:carboxymuconolactone decarboxylase family protein [Elusimicrobiota bacterium]